jgi:site-specific DNA-methyltransferase (adenine-specific)
MDGSHLYFGDNFDVLQTHVADDSIDLVYLDPPFNSKAKYNLLYEATQDEREAAQQTVFRDSWSWGDEAEFCLERILSAGGRTAALANALTVALQRSDTMAYLVMMGARLIEIHRVMKPTGSLYLHCDPTASHYLKLILDSIFGATNFQDEIIWQRTNAHNFKSRCYPRVHDVIFFYTKTGEYKYHQPYGPFSAQQLARYEKDPITGRMTTGQDMTIMNGDPTPWRGTTPRAPRGWGLSLSEREKLWRSGMILKRRDGSPRLDGRIVYLDEKKGVPVSDIWTDVPRIANTSGERLGYPTQKPLGLLKRIIEASSNKGDTILDPFCGCGTTVHAAATLGRKWVGIDVSLYGIRLIERRLKHDFGPKFDVPLTGIPKDLASAEALAERDAYGFQQWVVSELGCQFWNDGKKGRDTGIDGEMWFMSGPGKSAGRLLVQVKGGKRVGSPDVREFARVLDREKADLGIFFCRNAPTPDMRREAASLHTFNIGPLTLPRLQVFTLDEWFAGQRPKMPMAVPLIVPKDKGASKRGGRMKRPDPRQPQFAFSIEGGIAKPRKGTSYQSFCSTG